MAWYWWILFFALGFFALILLFHKLTARYVSPYTLDVYFGRKGCGKSTMLQKLAYKYHKRGWAIYANDGDSFISFVNYIDASHLWKFYFPANSVIFIDEVNLLWDNRDFKTFPKELQKFLRLQRHKRVKIIMFSQTYDCDKKIRDLADMLFIQNKFLRIFTVARAYVKSPVVLTSLETGSEGRISDDFKPLKIWHWHSAYIPKWVKKFDSFK